jgi:hypothetical protein
MGRIEATSGGPGAASDSWLLPWPSAECVLTVHIFLHAHTFCCTCSICAGILLRCVSHPLLMQQNV